MCRARHDQAVQHQLRRLCPQRRAASSTAQSFRDCRLRTLAPLGLYGRFSCLGNTDGTVLAHRRDENGTCFLKFQLWLSKPSTFLYFSLLLSTFLYLLHSVTFYLRWRFGHHTTVPPEPALTDYCRSNTISKLTSA